MTRLKPLYLSERTRQLLASGGVALWLTFPLIYMAGTHARWMRRCEGRTFNGAFDDCFNDALPVFEFMAFPVTLGLAYPFARFAFSMYAQSAHVRTTRWRLAGLKSGAEYYPLFQLLSAGGIGWTIMHIRSLPFSFDYWYLLAYWAAWLAWFLIGSLAAMPSTLAEQG